MILLVCLPSSSCSAKTLILVDGCRIPLNLHLYFTSSMSMISYLKLLCVTTHQPSSRFLTHSHLHLQASRQTGRQIELPFLFILIVTDGEMVEEYCCILLHCVCVVLFGIWQPSSDSLWRLNDHYKRERTSLWATSKGDFAYASSTPCLPIASSVAS